MKEREIFDAALVIADPGRCEEFLREACDGDAELKEHLGRLIAAHRGLGSFLEEPALGPAGPAPPVEGPGTVIGPYKLLEAIGEGGMGLVFMAEQTVPVRRKVALKVIKPGMDTKQVIARFEAERQALALMDHPSIAHVLDAGATDPGRPYFVMELVRGIPITEYCDREQLTIPERLRLFAQVCRAVQHAHQKGIIHRDLKPTNILVTLHDGVPVPKVIDFGVAKATGQSLTERTLFTGFAQLIGTPLYMSPEQAELSGLDVDTRSDIYSLGVLLYELLTGTPPFDQETFRKAALDEVRRIIREQEPPTPSTRLAGLGATLTAVSSNRRIDPYKLGRSLRGELDWIVMKALEKDRGRRYDSAGDLAADVDRHLADLPVEAGPPSPWYRLGKAAKRHRVGLTTATLVMLALLAGTTVSTWQAIVARRARAAAVAAGIEARRQRDQLRRAQYVADMRFVPWLMAHGAGREAREILDRHRPAPGQEELRGFEWSYVRGLTHADRAAWVGHDGREVYHIEYAPDGRSFATAGGDGTARVWDNTPGSPRLVLREHRGDVNWVSFDPSGSRLVTAGEDGTVRTWDATNGRPLGVIQVAPGEVVAALFTPDGRDVVAAARDGRLTRWDAATGRKWAEQGRAKGVWIAESLAIAPDGQRLALGSRGAKSGVAWVVLHDLRDGGLAVAADFETGTGPFAIAFAPNGSEMAVTGGATIHARIFDAATRRTKVALEGPHTTAYTLSFAPDGRTLAVGGTEGGLWLWDLAGATIRATLLGHVDRIWGAAFSPDGRTLATTSRDGTIRLWDATGQPDRVVFHGLLRGANPVSSASLAFADGGRRVLAASGAGEVLTCELHTGTAELLRPFGSPAGIRQAVLAPGGSRIAACRWRPQPPGARSEDERADLLLGDLRTGRVTTVLSECQPGRPAWSPDGARFAVGDHVSRDLLLWDAEGRRLARTPAGFGWGSSGPTFLHGNETLAALCGTWGGPESHPAELVVWDSARSRLTRPDPTGASPFHAGGIVASPDGRAIGSASGVIWEFPSMKTRFAFRGHDADVTDLAFAPDGRTFATASLDHTVRLWVAATGQEVLKLEGHPGPVRAVAFAPDGRALASCGDGPDDDVEVIIWRAEGRDESASGAPDVRRSD